MFVWNRLGSQRFILAIVALLLALTVFFNRATADSPNDAKQVAVDVVDRNAAQIATLAMCSTTLASRVCRNTRVPNI